MKDEIIISKNPKSSVSESFRTIRTNLIFSLSSKKSKVVLISSNAPSEGKTFISSNLAVAFSQIGKSTLLIDGDLRLGKLHKIFEVDNEEGFSNMLAIEDIKDYKKFIKKTSFPNLSIIPRGAIPPNPSELLNSDMSKKIFEKLRTSYDHIIIDGVPIDGLTDSLIMAGLADKTVLVASERSTKIDDILASKKALEQIHANIAGVIVNKSLQAKKGKYLHYYK